MSCGESPDSRTASVWNEHVESPGARDIVVWRMAVATRDA